MWQSKVSVRSKNFDWSVDFWLWLSPVSGKVAFDEVATTVLVVETGSGGGGGGGSGGGNDIDCILDFVSSVLIDSFCL